RRQGGGLPPRQGRAPAVTAQVRAGSRPASGPDVHSAAPGEVERPGLNTEGDDDNTRTVAGNGGRTPWVHPGHGPVWAGMIVTVVLYPIAAYSHFHASLAFSFPHG